MPHHVLHVGMLAIHPTHTDSITIREHLAGLPLSSRYASEIDAALNIMERCRTWLPVDTGAELSNAALAHNDSIYQTVSGYSPGVLAARLRTVSGIASATEIQAIAAFALASAVLSLSALSDCLQGANTDEIDALELCQTYLECIAECVPGAGVWLEPQQSEECFVWGDLASDAAKQIRFKIDGIRSGIVRRGKDGTAARDSAIHMKGLELIVAGTPYRNLNSKLRAWQKKENGEALSKVQMYVVMDRVGLSNFNLTD